MSIAPITPPYPIDPRDAAPIDLSIVYPRNGYTGEMLEGKPHGFGQMVWNTPLGQKVYTGFWQNGLRHGYGCSKYPDGTFYEGGWQNGEKDGWGQSTSSEELKLIGTYEKGQPNGYFLQVNPAEYTRFGYRIGDIDTVPTIEENEQGRFFCAGYVFIELWKDTEPSVPLPPNPNILIAQSLYKPAPYRHWQAEVAVISSLFQESQIYDVAHPTSVADLSTLQKAHLIFVRSHGSRRGLKLSDTEILKPRHEMEPLANLAETGAIVVLEGCYLGYKGNVAEKLSAARPDLYVIAPNGYARRTTVIRNKERLQLHFYGEHTARIDRIYHAGKLLFTHPVPPPFPIL